MVRGGGGEGCGDGAQKDGKARGQGLAGKGQGVAREVVFSEGRGLRARGAGPHVRRDISFAPHALTMTRWPKGGNVGVGVVPSLRACGARPSEGGELQCRSPTGERPEMTREVVFSEGRGLRAREYGPGANPSAS
jgi:hypothetical protein